MAVEESQQFCAQCQRYVLARRPGTNHVFHLLMCVFTCGLWVIVWFLSSAKVGGWRCSVCGGMQFGQAYGAPQVAGAAPAKSGPPRGLLIAGVSIGGFFALVFLVSLCSVMRKPQASVAASPTVASRAAEKRQAESWKSAPDVEDVGSIRADQLKPEHVDRTGDKLEVSRFHVRGWSLATKARFKSERAAWAVSLEGGGGDSCRGEHWAPYATLIEDEGNRPLSSKWYRLGGGPLDGLIARAATDCSMWHFGTPEYAALQGWKHTR